jgi:hypothetical protein
VTKRDDDAVAAKAIRGEGAALMEIRDAWLSERHAHRNIGRGGRLTGEYKAGGS